MKVNKKTTIGAKEIRQLEDKVQELTAALQRERADAENVRRRAESERLQMANFYKSMVVGELLPAIDNLERALKHIPKNLAGNSYVKGVQGVAKEFDNALQRIGLERIKTVGEHFDPHYHEAIGIEDKGGKKEIVSEELISGYKLGDEIIRHATVKVKRS